MHIFIRSLIETAKIFAIGIVCSIVFALMILTDFAITDAFVCLILNSVALFLFLYIQYRNWSKLYRQSATRLEYFVPSLTAFAVYAAVSSVLYSRRYSLYMWFFLPTRFLEPTLNAEFAYISVAVAHLFLLVLAFITPTLYDRQFRPRG